MPAQEPLDFLPLWAFFAVTVALVLLSIEVGFRIGRRRAASTDHESAASVGAMASASLALLAFLLAFTFGFAASASRRGGRFCWTRSMPSGRRTCAPRRSPSPSERSRRRCCASMPPRGSRPRRRGSSKPHSCNPRRFRRACGTPRPRSRREIRTRSSTGSTWRR